MLNLIKEWLRPTPRSASAFCERGRRYLQNGNRKKATSDLSKAIVLDPEMVDAYRWRGVAHLQAGNLDQAMADLNDALGRDSEDPWTRKNLNAAYYDRGRAAQARGEYASAIADYSEAIRLWPKSDDPYVSRGWVHAAMGELQKACVDWEKADPLTALKAACDSARSLSVQGRWQEGATCYEFALTIARKVYGEDDPVVTEVLVEYSKALQQMGRLEEADAIRKSVIAAAEDWVGGKTLAGWKLQRDVLSQLSVVDRVVAPEGRVRKLIKVERPRGTKELGILPDGHIVEGSWKERWYIDRSGQVVAYDVLFEAKEEKKKKRGRGPFSSRTNLLRPPPWP